MQSFWWWLCLRLLVAATTEALVWLPDERGTLPHQALPRHLDTSRRGTSNVAICIPHAVLNATYVPRTNSSFIHSTPGLFFACQGNSYSLQPYSGYNWSSSEKVELEVIDWNGDGHPDVIMGQDDGSVKLFKRVSTNWLGANEQLFADLGLVQTGTNASQRNPFEGIVVTPPVSPKSIDISGDGRVDVLLGTGDGLLLYLQRLNDTHVAPPITLLDIRGLASSNVSTYGTIPVVPQVVDWDHDGDWDILLFLRNASHTTDTLGTHSKFGIIYLERNGTTMSDWHIWNLGDPTVPDIFGLRSMLSLSSDKSVCAYDFTGDGSAELFVQGESPFSLRFFEQRARVLTEWTGSRNMFFSMPSVFASWLSQVGRRDLSCDKASILPTDWNNDGAPDIWYSCFTRSHGMYVVILRGALEDTLVEQTSTDSPFFGLPVQPDQASIDVRKIDGDDFSDLIVGSSDGITIYRRITHHGELQEVQLNISFIGRPAPHIVDWDQDGVPDMIVGSGTSGLRYFRGSRGLPLGIPAFVERTGADNPFRAVDSSFGSFLVVSSVDWNFDGRLDLVVGTLNSTLLLFTGVPNGQPGGTLALAWDSDIDSLNKNLTTAGCQQSAPDIVLTGSGAMNIFVGCGNGLIYCFIRYVEGGTSRIQFQKVFDPGSHVAAAPRGVDWDGDGDLDLLVGSLGGQVDYFAAGFCRPREPCSNRGTCGPNDGLCACYTGYVGTDCSKCDPDQAYSVPSSLPVWKARCNLCPSIEGSVCNKAGICHTDAYAQADVRTHRGTNTTAFMTSGTGACMCFLPGLQGTSCSSDCGPGYYLNYGLSDYSDVSVPLYNLSKGLFTACQPCEAGKYSSRVNVELCHPCPTDSFAPSEGSSSCTDCPWYLTSFQEGATSCSLSWKAPGLLGMLTVAITLIVLLLLEVIFHKVGINEVQTINGEVIVIVRGHHRISWTRQMLLAVNFFNTRQMSLDKPKEQWYCEVAGTGRLRLFQKGADGVKVVPKERLDTSHGHLKFRSWVRCLFLSFYEVPVLVYLFFLSGAIAALFIFSSQVLQAGWFNATLTGALLAPFLEMIHQISFVCGYRHEIRWKLWAFRKTLLQDRQVERVERGPSRAISIGQLQDLHDTFERFILDRNMYYVCSSIVLPLTAPEEVSLAELMGPKQADWFISHYWGMAFRDFVSTVREHASTAFGSMNSGPGWTSTAYWICTFSNNQWRIDEELGTRSSCDDSSFFIALSSGRCRGTLMVMDHDAMPLTRVWCLFEVLLTLKMQELAKRDRRRKPEAGQARRRNRDRLQTELLTRCRSEADVKSFQGLKLGTPKGVVNDGQIDVALTFKLADRLSKLNLENAEATVQEDKDMIHNLVRNEEGGFQRMNLLVADHIFQALQEARQRIEEDFEDLETRLTQGRAKLEQAMAPGTSDLSAFQMAREDPPIANQEGFSSEDHEAVPAEDRVRMMRL